MFHWKVDLKITTDHAGVQTGESFVLCLGSSPYEYWFMFHWKVDLMKMTTGHAGVQTVEYFVLCLGSTPHEYWFMFYWKVDFMKTTTGNAGVQTRETFVLCLGSSSHEYWFMFHWKMDLMKLTTGNAGVLTGESFVLCLGSTPHELKSRLNEDYYRPCRSADRGVIFFFQVPALMNTGSCSLDAMAVSALPIYSSWCKVSNELLSSLGIHQSVCLCYHFTFWLSLLKLLVFFLWLVRFSIFNL